MKFAVPMKKKREGSMYKMTIGKDVIYAKNKKELDQKLNSSPIMWHYKLT